jgi:hypothetical protein
MKKQKDNNEVMLVIVAIIFLIAFLVVSYEKMLLKEELQNYRESTQTSWNFTYFCDWNNIGSNETGFYQFSNYSRYLDQKDFYENIIHCEVKE